VPDLAVVARGATDENRPSVQEWLAPEWMIEILFQTRADEGDAQDFA